MVILMKHIRATNPIFENKSHGSGGGFAVLKNYWEKFDLSLLYMRLNKHSGTPSWLLLFMYVCGLLSNPNSVNNISQKVSESPVLHTITGFTTVTQCALSRFMARVTDWVALGTERLKVFLSHPILKLEPDDVIAVDDTKIEHPYGHKIPFLCWLFDSSEKINVYCMNLVTTLAVKANGLEFPLLWRIWRKTDKVEQKKSKIELVKQMLLHIRQQVGDIPLWVAMDRWFLCKNLFKWLESINFNWVTKAKSNTALFQLTWYDANGKPRFRPVNPRQLLMQVAHRFIGKKNERVSIAIPDIFIKMPEQKVGKRGRVVTKYKYVPIAAIAVTRLPEDVEQRATLQSSDASIAAYHGTHLIISNRHDAPEAALEAYVKRWRIEVFYRAAKQELGLTSCLAQNESSHKAHIEMLFVAETLVRVAMWELHLLNEEDKGDDIIFTHGQVLKGIFTASCRIVSVTQQGIESIQVYFDTTGTLFSRFIRKKWPTFMSLVPWVINHIFESTA